VRIEPELLLAGEGQELGPQEWVLYKPRLSAFFGTPLETQLHELGVTTVVICGCDFPNSPRASIYAASNRDFRIVLVADAVSRTTDMGLQELGSIGVRLMNTADCLAWLTADTTGRPQRAVETQA
jgi:nicotinamidase-related amidase